MKWGTARLWDAAQDACGHARLFDRLAQPLRVRVAAHAVHDHAFQAQRGVVVHIALPSKAHAFIPATSPNRAVHSVSDKLHNVTEHDRALHNKADMMLDITKTSVWFSAYAYTCP